MLTEKETKDLKEVLKKGNHTVYCVLRHVSRSGMMRAISLFTIVDNELYWLDYSASQLLNRKRSRKYDGIIVHGCGMDMGFELVYSLSVKLYCGYKDYNHDLAYRLKSRWI